MDNPQLQRTRGLGNRKHVSNMDRVNPNSSDILDNRAMGVASLVARALLDGDVQVDNPVMDTSKQSVAVSFSNNTNQIRVGTYSEPNIATNQFAKMERKRSKRRH